MLLSAATAKILFKGEKMDVCSIYISGYAEHFYVALVKLDTFNRY